ncbi:MAG: hypothetical protein ACLFM5_11110 [Spirochaetaceae bacterium]
MKPGGTAGAGYEDGGLSVAALALVTVVAVLGWVVLALQATGNDLLRRSAEERAARAEAMEVVAEIVELLESDSTPTAHSFHDPLWKSPPEGVELADVTAREPAWASERVYLNVNTAPRRHLEAVAAGRLPPERSVKQVLAPVFAARRRAEQLTAETLRLALGRDHRVLAPVFTAEPLLNVNTASRSALEGVLAEAAEAAEIAETGRLRDCLFRAREQGELDRDDLEVLLGAETADRLRTVLGVRTLVIRALIPGGARRYEADIAWIPAPERRYRVLSFSEVRE